MDMRRIAQGLGWFSIVLDVVQLLASQELERLLGVEPHRTLLRALGVREVVPGVAILMQPNPAPQLWARLAGDILDLGLLAAAWRGTTQRNRLIAVTGSVVAVTALDVICVQQLRER